MKLEHIADGRWRASALNVGVTFTREDLGPLLSLMAQVEKSEAKRVAPDPLGLKRQPWEKEVEAYLASGGSVKRATANPVPKAPSGQRRPVTGLTLEDLGL